MKKVWTKVLALTLALIMLASTTVTAVAYSDSVPTIEIATVSTETFTLTNTYLAAKAYEIATSYQTTYAYGAIGQPLYESNKNKLIYRDFGSLGQLNLTEEAIHNGLVNATADTFAFDCSGLIKSILWGWNGNTSAVYGGASYASNGFPDINANTMIERCSDVSTDFSNIEVGEVVWISGHIGIYIGDGLVVECTPKWDCGVQITACNRTIEGYYTRDWTKHGKLPYITYEKSFSITYDANGGYNAPEAQVKPNGEPVILTKQIPEKYRCRFIGWQSNDDEEAIYMSGDVYSKDADVLMTAIWIEIPYIDYFFDGALLNGEAASAEALLKVEGIDHVIGQNMELTREGYFFKGWATEPDSSQVVYRNGDVYSTEKSLTLYAVWEKEYLPGDVDSNGIINMVDVLTLCQYYVDGCNYDPDGYAVTINENAGDVDGNGIINMIDVLTLCQYYVDGCKYDPDGYAVKLVYGNMQ